MLKLLNIIFMLIQLIILIPSIRSHNISQPTFTQYNSATLYNSQTILPQMLSTYNINFLKSYISIPLISIGLSHYQGMDESRYEDFYIQVDQKKINMTGCIFNFKPGMSTSIVMLKINYIVVENKYNNWYAKNYVFNSFQLFIGTGVRQEKFGPYNLSEQFGNVSLSSIQNNNKIFLSETGYQFTTSLNQKYDNLLTVQYINTTFIYITASTKLGGSWTQINFQATLIIVDKFPSNIKFIMSNFIMTPNNLVYDITQLFGQNKIIGFSKLLGYNGFMANDTGKLDYSWTEKSLTTYEYSLGNLLEVRAVFMAIYNETEILVNSDPNVQIQTSNYEIIVTIVVNAIILIISIVAILVIMRIFFSRRKILNDDEKKKLIYTTFIHM